ncbi:hypothetical protein B0O99DRAFT_518399 [Bisporella sp. PMI_857]|nr:hypothetical protein B0O99DRAFT_518399 [Bisporella sp. PMI_857]
MAVQEIDTDTSKIREWRSIVTLVVFVLTNLVVLFPFHIPIFIPRPFANFILDSLSAFRVISPRQDRPKHDDQDKQAGESKPFFLKLNFPLNFVTAPLIADLFLLAILAIGSKEVHDGTIGANNISPLDIMVFFITLAYIAISIDASGLIRYLAFKVLQKGGKVGGRLFFFLYAFFFGLGSFIGNDPIILSGTAFLAYMTRVSSNIRHPRAWIHTQFAVANIASAILVSSNPTNLVLAGAFEIKFINYTANMIVPVIVTAIVLFPFLLYIIFADETLIPMSITMHELSEEAKAKKPVNPNIPHARGNAEEEANEPGNEEQGKLLSLEEIMNPFLDKKGATFGAVIMAATLVTLLAINGASQTHGEQPVFYVTLPAAFVMFCWDVSFGWIHREETRGIARKGRQEYEEARAQRLLEEEQRRVAEEQERQRFEPYEPGLVQSQSPEPHFEDEHPIQTDSGASRDNSTNADDVIRAAPLESSISMLLPQGNKLEHGDPSTYPVSSVNEKQGSTHSRASQRNHEKASGISSAEVDEKKGVFSQRVSISERISQEVKIAHRDGKNRPTLISLIAESYTWTQDTFPTVTAVLAHLPFALIPFAFTMFVLVQALVTKGWVQVFAYGWDHWVNRTGTVGAIGGMGFLSVILCNFAGTNIGTTILLCRIIQTWQEIHRQSEIAISNRTFWATIYSMALGVNYGAFSTAFSASLAGLLWRDILARKHIRVRRLEFARVNLPIIAIAMAVGLAVLVGQVYIVRGDEPYANPAP